jgi:hypothetical protein
VNGPEVFDERYEVLGTVSDGRRAAVLQALDQRHERLVALKVYPVADADRDDLLAEVRLLMSIEPHPGLPVVRGDFFTPDGDRYVVVMNWVDGSDLQHDLEERGDPGLPLDEVLEELTQVASALDHLHAHEPPIVHGDVKPANLVKTAGGRVVLVDFDIAGAQLATGRVGTVGYVAPEVAAGEKPSPAADVFGLAATAVALLNGRPPTEAVPSYPGLEPLVQARLARVLRSALAVDPTRRPSRAGDLVERLRTARRTDDHPSGVVALLATEVADASLMWAADKEEMQAAMSRLRDVQDDVVESHGGHVATSMNEGNRMIAVFRDASAAASAALALHDRVAEEPFPPGIEVRLQASVAVGEAVLVDGVYGGAVVDHVLGLRGSAAPGSTITSEPTAELLVGMIGQGLSIVPLGEVVSPQLAPGTAVFGLTRPGQEASTAVASAPVVPSAPPTFATPVPKSGPSRWAVAGEAALASSTLVALTVVGLAAISLFVLASELDTVGLSSAALILGVVASFGWHYSRGYAAAADQIHEEERDRAIEEQARRDDHERSELRHRLDAGFAHLGTEGGREGIRVLDGLADEYDAAAELLRRSQDRPAMAVSALLPQLVEETHHHGMTALSDALELLEFADGAQRHRLQRELEEIEARVDDDAYVDDRERSRDEQRLLSHRQLLARHVEARQRAQDLLFEAERCRDALAETRIELASVRAGDTQVDVDAVVQTLQDTIHRVRDVQEELRALGY